LSRDLTQDWLDRALALCELGRLQDADEALREALREDPDDPVTHGIRALVLMDLDRPKDALQAASTAIALAPDLPLGHTARTRALLALERFDEAQASANEAIRLDPEDADGHVLLAFVLVGRERWAEALVAADKALSLEPESESARGVRSVALGMTHGGPEWQTAAGETLAVAPGSSVAHALAGQAHLMRGGEREAAERFREALRLDPESEFAQAGLAEAMKASHPLFRPLFRFFMWQERLSTGWKAALIIGPLIALRALHPAADNPFVIALIVLWIAFVALTWLGVPLANVALRFSPVGRAVLPADQKRSSAAFLAFLGGAGLAVVVALAVRPGFLVTVLPMVLLAFVVGNAHVPKRRWRRIVYASAITAGVAAFVGGTLIAAGAETAGVVLLAVSLVTAVVLLWIVRLG
jgi:tetratricopeptide (TPR) repeat protein